MRYKHRGIVEMEFMINVACDSLMGSRAYGMASELREMMTAFTVNECGLYEGKDFEKWLNVKVDGKNAIISIDDFFVDGMGAQILHCILENSIAEYAGSFHDWLMNPNILSGVFKEGAHQRKHYRLHNVTSFLPKLKTMAEAYSLKTLHTKRALGVEGCVKVNAL
jgi:hypothetical protein